MIVSAVCLVAALVGSNLQPLKSGPQVGTEK
jgi:hypothetical protein